MRNRVLSVCLLVICQIFIVSAEAVVENNRNYGYVYWEYGMPTELSGRRPQSQANVVARANPNVIIQTGYYSLRLDCDDMELTGYDALSGSDYMTALHEDVTAFSSAQLNLYVYKDGTRYTCTSGVVQDSDTTYVRLIENGQFVQRIDHLGLVFEDAGGNDLDVYGRLEITAWPDRVCFLLDFRAQDGSPLTTGITRTTIQLISPASQEHLADTMADHVRLAVQPHLDTTHGNWTASSYITEAVNNTTQAALAYSFDLDEHALKVDVPADSVSFPADVDRVDEYLIELTNPQASPVNIPIVFDAVNHRAITGGVMVLCEEDNGAPTGIPVQVSKNWHGGSTDIIHKGSWVRGSTAFTLAAGESKRLVLKIIYGHWAGVPAASHASLSIIGWGTRDNWKWEESALGAWGEGMTFDPALHAGESFLCDIRPSYTLGYTSGTAYSWTENSGGGDFLIYYDNANTYRWVKCVKTAFRWTGPNLTEVHYSGITDDDKIRVTYSSQLPRTYDYHRRFQSFKYEFLQNVTSPQRLVFYQMAADYYIGPDFTNYYRGDDGGLMSSYVADPGGNTYKGSFDFYDRWLAIDDATTGSYDCFSRRGMLWRKSTLNGSDFTPWFHTYGRTWGSDKLLFDLSADSVSRSYSAGDVVEGQIEFIMPAKSTDLYWGEDSEFNGRLGSYTNPWQAAYDEYRYNQLSVTAHSGTLVNCYPVEIDAADDPVLADFTINSGGIGHVPIIITNVPRGNAVSVQRYIDGEWSWLESVSISGNDYYQGYQNANGKMDYAFTVNRPSANLNESWRIRILNYVPIFENVALNGTATQSSTDHGGVASRAIDGNTSGVWSQGSVTHTDADQPPHWWQVDLGDPYEIEEIQIYNRTDCCMDRLSDFDVYILNCNGNEVWTNYQTDYPDPSVFLDAEGAAGRFVMIQLRNPENALSLAEVRVLSVNPARYCGDLTLDGKVNLEDFAALSAGWLSTYTMEELRDIANDWLAGTTQ